MGEHLYDGLGFRVWGLGLGFSESQLHSRKLAWKPKKGPIKTTVPLKGGYMGFHVSLGECASCIFRICAAWYLNCTY